MVPICGLHPHGVLNIIIRGCCLFIGHDIPGVAPCEEGERYVTGVNGCKLLSDQRSQVSPTLRITSLEGLSV
ncbi:hypothetical protein J6590_059672 [Homalodisca vitripennis]|nr:hypothetical protein J6590_059672 [Homalodisca vitripennis]